MKKPFTALLQYFIKGTGGDNFVMLKKAQFMVILSVSLFILMSTLTATAFFIMRGRFFEIFIMALPVLFITMVCLALVKTGKVQGSANLMALSVSAIAALGFVLRDPSVAGVSMGYFMYVALAFATMFSRVFVSTAILFLFLVTHSAYYFLKAMPIAAGPVANTARTSFLDGIITLICLYIVCTVVSSFLKRAVEKTEEELEKNKAQYDTIITMMETIQGTSKKLNDATTAHNEIITQFNNNAQSQAASMEQLTATMEEISANTTNVTQSTREQTGSVKDLIESMETLSSYIDIIKSMGSEISLEFTGFMTKAEKGEESSKVLDDINKKILENSASIISVITIIEDFFDRINLLSLNASIEAARAGEFGTGFAVVATEIGKLADHSSQELKQIWELIEKNREDVENGNSAINAIITFITELIETSRTIQQKSAETLKTIAEQKRLKDEMNRKISTVREKLESIEFAIVEQENAIHDIVSSIDDTNRTVQSNSDTINALKSTAEELKELAAALVEGFESPETGTPGVPGGPLSDEARR